MQIYLVGGAVRDKLLGRPGGDRDYVVVGATPQQLMTAGYRPVGKDFPVFLHPETQQEYALARTERKAGPGYRGFTVHAEPDVSLEQDLSRRDLTINAIAEDQDGRLVDPYGGVADVRNRILRHVSPAFVEDPVRLLRVARFAARYASYGFTIAAETLTLLRAMVASGEVDHLVPERVWAETRKALTEPQPSVFLQVLEDTGALPILFPEVASMVADHDRRRHLHQALDMAATLYPADDTIAYAVLAHDLGTPPPAPDQTVAVNPAPTAGKLADPGQAMSARLKVPHHYAQLASLVWRWHRTALRAREQSTATILQLLEALDGLKRPERLDAFLAACEAAYRACPQHATHAYPAADYLRAARAAAANIQARDLVLDGLTGTAIGAHLRTAREHAIGQLAG